MARDSVEMKGKPHLLDHVTIVVDARLIDADRYADTPPDPLVQRGDSALEAEVGARIVTDGGAGLDDQVKVSDALLVAARQRNDEADVRYGSGLMSFDIWEGIVSDRVSAERSALSARRAAMDAETAWHRALGRALGE